MVLADAQLDSHSHQLGFIHDELQYETIPASVNDLKFLLELTAAQAGEYYKLRIPIAADANIGDNWAEVH
jgi:DNA polymerase I-like protein with 3'-5' exonuclease and polymerase domains